jgi:hypothetical protein
MNHGPPDREAAGPDTTPAPTATKNNEIPDSNAVAAKPRRHAHFSVAPRRGGNATPRGISYATSRRMEPLPHCGCIQNPLTDRHRCDGEISDVMAEAYAAAVEHLRAQGLQAAPLVPELRALWRHGGHDRELAQQLWELAR